MSKHCLTVAPVSALSAIACHLPQLVPFHFITARALNSRNDRDRSRSSETLSCKPANHNCLADKPVCFTTSPAFQLTGQTLEMIWHVRLTDFRWKRWRCVCFTLELAVPPKFFIISNKQIFFMTHMSSSDLLSSCWTLWGANSRAIRDMICMKRDEWVGESCVWACVCACVLILSSLRYDSPTGGFWARTRSRTIQMLEDHSRPTWLCSHQRCCCSIFQPEERLLSKCSGRFYYTMDNNFKYFLVYDLIEISIIMHWFEAVYLLLNIKELDDKLKKKQTKIMNLSLKISHRPCCKDSRGNYFLSVAVHRRKHASTHGWEACYQAS